ncbi:MAG: metallophosphoesterase family protein [Clostridiales bacterium]|nr:metallophosphoesterase family protein [Clostridiales bacterium]
MRILILSDVPDKKYWDFYREGIFDGIDLILSCGDLPPQYLEFIVTFTNAPLVYVRGNHDDCYKDTPPGGCICAEDTVCSINGVRICGLGGSMRYKETGDNQFTEKEMKKRVRKLRRQIKKAGGVDIILTHSAIRGFDDDDDLPHQGFEAFEELIDAYEPRYFIHGHVHLNYGRKHKRVDEYKGITVINGYQSYLLEY